MAKGCVRDGHVEQGRPARRLRLERVIGIECVALRETERDLPPRIEVDARPRRNVDGQRAAGGDREIRHRARVERVGARRPGGADDQSIADRPTAGVIGPREARNDDATTARRNGVDRFARVHR